MFSVFYLHAHAHGHALLDLVILPLNFFSRCLWPSGKAQNRLWRFIEGHTLPPLARLEIIAPEPAAISGLMCIASFEILLLRVTRHSPQGLTCLHIASIRTTQELSIVINQHGFWSLVKTYQF